MDKQSLHETAKRPLFELPFVELCWPFGPEFDVLKLAARFLCCRRSCAASLYQSEVRSTKSLLNQQIYPSIAGIT